jgi:hypothetical protein
MRHRHATRRKRIRMPSINIKAVVFSILWIIMCFWGVNQVLDLVEDTEYALIEACYDRYERNDWDGYEAAAECE